MDVWQIGTRGFAMPVLSVVDAGLTYAINQMFTSLGQISIGNGHALAALPEYGLILISVAIMIVSMTLLDYFEDLRHGLDFPKQAVVYAIGVSAGLAYFGGAIGDVSLGGIGSDAIYSSIASIIILIIGAAISTYLNRSSNSLF